MSREPRACEGGLPGSIQTSPRMPPKNRLSILRKAGSFIDAWDTLVCLGRFVLAYPASYNPGVLRDSLTCNTMECKATHLEPLARTLRPAPHG